MYTTNRRASWREWSTWLVQYLQKIQFEISNIQPVLSVTVNTGEHITDVVQKNMFCYNHKHNRHLRNRDIISENIIILLAKWQSNRGADVFVGLYGSGRTEKCLDGHIYRSLFLLALCNTSSWYAFGNAIFFCLCVSLGMITFTHISQGGRNRAITCLLPE